MIVARLAGGKLEVSSSDTRFRPLGKGGASMLACRLRAAAARALTFRVVLASFRRATKLSLKPVMVSIKAALCVGECIRVVVYDARIALVVIFILFTIGEGKYEERGW